MSGPSMMPLCQPSSFASSSVAPLPEGIRSWVSGTDQRIVLIGGFKWFPSLFQINQESPVDESVKMSGSMLPPPKPSTVGALQPFPSWQTTGWDPLSRYGPVGRVDVATPMHWSPGVPASVAV